MRKFLSRLVTKLVYPDGLCCVMCDREMSDGKSLCSACLPDPISKYCERCGNTLANESQRYCDNCVTMEYPVLFDEARAPFGYADDKAHKMVWKLKYGNAPYMAIVMANYMSEVLAKQSWDIDFVTYVPMHPKKERKRGYNQALLLAQNVAEKVGLPVRHCLEKLTYGKKSATSLGREDRIKLMSGSFGLLDCDLKGKSILLIDDVVTSKATSNECAKMLKLGKAKRVYVLSFATSRGDGQMLYDPNVVQKIK